VTITEAKYDNYSDDGKSFWNGFEKTETSFTSEIRFENDIILSGVEPGEMKLRAVFSSVSGGGPKLLFESASDGKPKSYGYAKYKGITLDIKDMLE